MPSKWICCWHLDIFLDRHTAFKFKVSNVGCWNSQFFTSYLIDYASDFNWTLYLKQQTVKCCLIYCQCNINSSDLLHVLISEFIHSSKRLKYFSVAGPMFWNSLIDGSASCWFINFPSTIRETQNKKESTNPLTKILSSWTFKIIH